MDNYKDYTPGPHKLLRHLDHLQKIIKGVVCGPLHVSYFVTNRCQLMCPYCCFQNQIRDNVELSLKDFKLSIDVLKKYGLKAAEMSLRGDEIIYFHHGGQFKITTIKEFVENFSNYKDSYSYCLNDAAMLGKITNAYEHECKEDLVKITLKNGKTITTTKSHSIYFYENNKIASKYMSEAKIGDLVVLSRSKIKTSDCHYYNIDLSNFDNTRSNRPDFVKFDKNVARLLGYFNAEGTYLYCRGVVHGINLCFDKYENENKYVDDIVNISKEYFNYDAIVRKESNKTWVSLNKKWIGELFQYLDCGNHSHRMRVPNIIFNLNDECKYEYLKGLIAGDGNYRNNVDKRTKNECCQNALHLKTSSPYLVRTVSLLLDTLDIKNSVTTGMNKKRLIEGRELKESVYYVVNVYGFNNLIKLKEVIEFKGKSLQYKDTQYSFRGSRNTEITINDDAYALPIKKIEIITNTFEKVYDITVENTHRFESSFRILCHNTGGGDPLLWNHTVPAVDYATKKGIKLSLVTNGLALKDIPQSTLQKFAWIRISVQSTKYAENIAFDYIPDDIKKSMSYIVHNQKSLDELEKLYKFAKETGTIIRVAPVRPCSQEWADKVEEETLKFGYPFLFFRKESGAPRACYFAYVRAAVDWRGNFVVCPSPEQAYENYGELKEDFALCKISKLEEWLQNNPPHDLGFRCSYCNCGKNSNDLIYSLLQPMENDEFV